MEATQLISYFFSQNQLSFNTTPGKIDVAKPLPPPTTILNRKEKPKNRGNRRRKWVRGVEIAKIFHIFSNLGYFLWHGEGEKINHKSERSHF